MVELCLVDDLHHLRTGVGALGLGQTEQQQSVFCYKVEARRLHACMCTELGLKPLSLSIYIYMDALYMNAYICVHMDAYM